MRFIPTNLNGAFVIELERREDVRGFFARTFCRRELAGRGLCNEVVQVNLAFNHHRGTIRGLHFQHPPAAETKLIRCVRGAIHDVIVDLRPESPTYLQHAAVELTAENRIQLFVPERFAHGYQTLTDDSEILYLVSEYYSPQQEAGVRYDDATLKIEWPLPPAFVSEKDASWPPLQSPRE